MSESPPEPHVPASPTAPTQSLPATGSPVAPQAAASNFPAPPHPHAEAHTAVWALGLVSLVATVVGLSVDEDGHNAWSSVHAWGGVAILGALLTLAPALRSALNLSSHRTGQVAGAGAGALGLFWVLLVLPRVGSNTSLVTTIGTAAGLAAAWVAPGREMGTEPGPRPRVW